MQIPLQLLSAVYCDLIYADWRISLSSPYLVVVGGDVLKQTRFIMQIFPFRKFLSDSSFHQLLVYADGINMLGENLQTVMENTEIFIKASKDNHLEENLKITRVFFTLFWPKK